MVFDDIQNGGEIDQSAEVLQLLNGACMKDEYADVTFIVENTKIPAHKIILALRSFYFDSLFCAEAKKNEFQLKARLGAFKAILKYIYTGRLSLVSLSSEQIIEIYDLANQYGFDTLEKFILKYLKVNLKLDNCIPILNASYLYSLDDLQDACMKFMDCHSIELLDHNTFKVLSQTSLCTLLKRDTFYAPEIDIFKAICNWSKNNPDADVKEALTTIRWTEVSMNDYFNIVMPSNILDQTELSRMVNENRGSNNISRTQCRNSSSEKDVEKNIATIEHGAKTISGGNPSALLNGDFTDYNVDLGNLAGYTYHTIDNRYGYVYGGNARGNVGPMPLHAYSYVEEENRRGNNSSIKVDLGQVRFINHIKMLLMDKDDRSYSYHIDVSIDGREYVQLINRTKYYYKSWQHLYFKSRPVRFIKLVGTRVIGIVENRDQMSQMRQNMTIHQIQQSYLLNCQSNCSFAVVGLQAMYLNPELVDGVIKPQKNITTLEYGASVVQGCGGNNMLNTNSDEFTCHELGSCIIIQLNKTYYIDSLRMLLGHRMNYLNKYSFCIETSLDDMNWELAVDKRNEAVSEWQEFDFIGRPAVFIRITGTQRDVNFICTYFECPRNPQRPELK